MNHRLVGALGIVLSLAAGRATAQSDVPGSKDHPLITRYAGSTIIDYLDKNFEGADAMKKAIAETGRVALYGLFFDTGKAEMKPESRPALDEIIKLLNGEPTMRLLVVGHTDTVGSPQSNQELSLRRAQSVVDTLVKGRGIEPGRLQAAGVGFASPIATNRTEQGRARNRRVELVQY